MKWEEFKEIGNRWHLIEYTLKSLNKESAKIILQEGQLLRVLNTSSTYDSGKLINDVFREITDAIILKQRIIKVLEQKKADLEGRLDPIRLEF